MTSLEEVNILPVDKLIIEGVEAQKILYDSSSYTDEGYKFAEITAFKTLAYTRISKKILKILDLEYTGEQVKKRWEAIRRSFVNAVNKGKDYYLKDYLQFLIPHLKAPRKKTQEYVRKQHVSLKFSDVMYETSSDDEIQVVEEQKKDDVAKYWIPELDFNGKNDGCAYEPGTSDSNKRVLQPEVVERNDNETRDYNESKHDELSTSQDIQEFKKKKEHHTEKSTDKTDDDNEIWNYISEATNNVILKIICQNYQMRASYFVYPTFFKPSTFIHTLKINFLNVTLIIY